MHTIHTKLSAWFTITLTTYDHIGICIDIVGKLALQGEQVTLAHAWHIATSIRMLGFHQTQNK